MPSSRVFALLAATTLLGVVGVVAPVLASWALFLDVLVLLAFAYDLRRARQVPLAATRQWPPLLVQGAEAPVELELTTAGSRAAVVRLRDGLHPGLAAAPQRIGLVLDPGERTAWPYKIRPRRRGEHRAGPLMARVLGPWGLAWSQRQVLPEEVCRVYPQVRWDGKVGHLLLLAHRRALGRNPRRLQGQGSEPYGLRAYLPGDPPGKIHWKATARHGSLVSREDTWERGARLVVLLDCGRGMSGRDGERSKLDHALAAALALSRVAVSRGDQVTLVAFSDRIERKVRIHGGQRSLQTAYGLLYDLQARLVEPAYDAAAALAMGLEARRSTIVLFTSVVDLAAADLLRQALLRLEQRHRPLLLNLEDPELDALAYDAPETADEAFAKVAALELMLANRRLAKQLRHAGIRVVGTSADRLALEALEAYLAMFKVRAA